MLEKLADIERRYSSLEARLGSPDVVSDHVESTKIHRAMREIVSVVEKVRELRKAREELAGAREMLDTLPAGDELRDLHVEPDHPRRIVRVRFHEGCATLCVPAPTQGRLRPRRGGQQPNQEQESSTQQGASV